MPRASLRTAAALLAVMTASGCSFEGSVHGTADDSSSSRTSSSRASTSTAATTSSSRTDPGSGTPTPTTAAAGSTTGTPSGPDRCHTADLTASLVPGNPGAGQRYATVVLTDSGGLPCTVHGYGGLSLAGPGGAPLPTRQ